MNHLKMLLNASDANVPELAYWQKSAKENIMKNPALKERKNPRLHARENISFCGAFPPWQSEQIWCKA